MVANDPDADRCAVAVPGGPHGWQMLRGDEVGALLAQHLLELRREGVYATSIVSSSLLGKMAVAEKQLYAETLTGFKWIGRVENLAFGYEEALGYCVDPTHVKDKDGVSALMMVCDIAARAKAAGRTLRDLLDDLAREYGLHATDQLSVRMDDLAAIPAVVDRLRDQPPDLARRSRGRAGRRPLARARTTCRRRSGCASGWPTTAGSSYAPRGRSPRSSATSRSSYPWSDEEDGVDAARISAVGRLDAIRGDLQAAAGLVSPAQLLRTSRAVATQARRAARPAGSSGRARRGCAT